MNRVKFNTVKYNSLPGTGPTPAPSVNEYDKGITRSAYWLERIVRGL